MGVEDAEGSLRAVFYDTWGFIALANARDPDHALAARVDAWREERRYVVVTSDYVLNETLTGLHAEAGARVAIRFLELFLVRVAAETVLLLEVNGPRRDRAFELFRRLAPDTPRLSFTDATTFALMRELGLSLAFTPDPHFHKAGGHVEPMFQRRRGELLWVAPGDG